MTNFQPLMGPVFGGMALGALVVGDKDGALNLLRNLARDQRTQVYIACEDLQMLIRDVNAEPKGSE